MTDKEIKLISEYNLKIANLKNKGGSNDLIESYSIIIKAIEVSSELISETKLNNRRNEELKQK